MAIYNFLIQPLVLIIDILFVWLYDFFGVPGVAVIFLSLFVNLMAMPLYRQADRLQKAEQAKQTKMKPGVDHIKKTFSGDEQYMMLSAYYRIEHYRPLSVLKESFPLLLQVPIFIAAYRYLSNAAILTGSSLGPIRDLGAPDSLISIGSISINILPILMTVLNLISGLIYTRGRGIRVKLQALGLAAVFLVLLYNSPSGLVLYWTMSQIFSLVKNLIMETDILKKQNILLPLSVATIFVVLICTAASIIQDRTGEVISEFFLILSFIYLVKVILKLKNIELQNPAAKIEAHVPGVKYADFLAVCVGLFALLGICIPASVLSASISEFIETTTGTFQSFLLTYPVTVYAGLFLLWTSIYFYFSGRHGRKILFGLLLVFFGTRLINYFAFDIKPEFYYTDLSFDGELPITRQMIVLNIICSLLVVAVLIVLWVKKQKILKRITVILAAALLFLGGYHILQIPNAIKEVSNAPAETAVEESNELNGIFALSKTEKNVIILMLDRAIGSYVPFIFDELPELKTAFDGFVYYPNTISYCSATSVAAPPLYGGYEYTPKRVAENTAITDTEQKRESFLVLPALFSENNYNVTVCDPALFDISIYEDYPDIAAYNLSGKFNYKLGDIYKTDIVPIQKHNFLVFSLYKTSPLFQRDYIYDNGGYMTAENSGTGYTQAFIDNYSALLEFPNLTVGTDADKGSFLFLQNSTTHEPTALDAPDYAVTQAKNTYKTEYGERTVDGRTMTINDFFGWKHYCVNLISYRELAKWFETMKELGVYDNTRIILVADHGARLRQFEDFILTEDYDVETYNPLLMVKDFDSHGELSINNAFMTNADTPTLATEGVIDDPINPLTGKPISSEEKNTEAQWIECGVKRQKTTKDDPLLPNEIIWWTVHDSIFDRNNWEYVE